ncbi:HET-domain-containing protein [Patellaria atrata CBS 101060]|uniref:HET-domain-containing protein n=1 Tax=Patellaria atrata CBS 101060 TaxID=1346257 RepID=A0A9P4S882_9PEZI|nr:HET-domain-containing protein [Patellaria atrata CBS 101060]
MAPFQYVPLPDQASARILVLEPGSGEDPIHCQLSITGVNSKDPFHCRLPSRDVKTIAAYEALSYVWGDNTRSRKVLCHGEDLAITESLYVALRRLRYPDKKRMLWADAICINQDDIPERNQQVPIMREIYSNASRTLVWLGECTDSDVIAIRFLERLAQTTNLFSWGSEECRTALRQVVRNSKDSLAELTSFEALQGFLSHSWFERVWVLQEIGVSKTAIVLCGEHELSWDSLELSIETIFTDHLMMQSMSHSLLISNSFHIVFLMQRTRDRYAQTLPLSLLLYQVRYHKSTDPRDRIYAVFPLATDVPHIQLQVDYSLPLEKVFIQATRWCLESFQPYFPLSLAARNSTAPSDLVLPSWVPDFQRLSCEGYFQFSPAYQAGSRLVHNPRYEGVDKEILVLSGRVFSRVSKVLSYVDHVQSNDATELRAWLMACRNLASERPVSRNEPFDELWWRLVVRDGGEKDGSWTRTRRWDGVGAYGSHYLDPTVSAYLFGSDLSKDSVVREEQIRYRNAFMTHRDFCLTDNGFLGWVPIGTRIEDYVCLARGGPVPLILRNISESKFQLVGDAYIHGIMDGEVMPDDWEHKYGDQDLFIH